MEAEIYNKAKRACKIVVSEMKKSITASSLYINKGEMLSISAGMDVKSTTNSLNEILHHKKEVAKLILQSHNDTEIEQLNELFDYYGDIIHRVLGLPLDD